MGLSGSPLIRSVLTLLALVYDLGHHARREQVAEMFVTLGGGRRHRPFIDPVRAGLLADTCYHVNPDCPQLQPIQTYPRWDRFGFRASQAYDRLREWLARHRQSTSLAPPALLHRMIRELLPPESTLTFSELESLRVLMETLQHFWQLSQPTAPVTVDNTRQAIAEFLQLIDQGIVAARPLPEPSTWLPPSATVTLATIYQYRARRCHHRWQIWLDAGDRLWEMAGVSQLFAAPLFRRGRPPQPWSVTEQQTLNQDRFKRIIFDLTARVTERLILAHSDIGVRGTEQTGQLLGLLDRAETIPLSTVTAN